MNNEFERQLPAERSHDQDVPPNPGARPSQSGQRDTLFILFQHKWMILILTVIGLIGAAAAYVTRPTVYQSQAKLLIDYVLSRSSINSVESEMTTSSGLSMSSAINSELEILTSMDLAKKVAEKIGPEKLLPGAADAGVNEAAARIYAGISVENGKNSQVIRVSYSSGDPSLAVSVLDEFVNQYFRKHIEVRRSVDVSKVNVRKEFIKGEIKRNEDAIKDLVGTLELGSINEERASVIAQITKVEEELIVVETELAGLTVLLDSFEAARAKGMSADVETPVIGGAPSQSVLDEYSRSKTELAFHQQESLSIRKQYKSGTAKVRNNQREIDRLQAKTRSLEKKYPALVATPGLAVGSALPQMSNVGEVVARIEARKAERSFLISKLESKGARYQKLMQMAPGLRRLTDKRELLESEQAHLQSIIDKDNADKGLFTSGQDESKFPLLDNIDVIQAPSLAVTATSKQRKMLIFGLAGGGVGAGVGLALLIGLFLDTSVKRPHEIESGLRLPLMMSIPFIKAPPEDEAKLLGDGGSPKSLSPWDEDHFIRPFSDAIRDRLGYQFDVDGLLRTPKLVGLTGFSDDAGTSTLAASLAASFAATLGGKVLFVELNGRGSVVASQGDEGDSNSLTNGEGIGFREQTSNLFVATISGGSKQLSPKKLHELLPQFRASDFEYIIFNMPPVGSTSPTLAMAGFMDKVLLIVDAGKTNRDVIKRSYQELVATKADVSTILNKTRTSLPSWLQG